MFPRFREFRERVDAVFLKHLQGGTASAVSWKDYVVQEMWTEARENYSHDDPDWVEIEESGLFTLIAELFDEAGGYEHPGSISIEGGPGCSSSVTVFHAPNPEETLTAALTLLEKRLEPELVSSRRPTKQSRKGKRH